MKKALGYISIILLFSCAQQVAPTGGPKDETPPKILSEVPSNLSTDFTSKQIVISFDEFIQLKSPAEQVVISPPMLKSPSYQLKKKSLVVKFEEVLRPNTTYTINFGEAIADNNEGNVLANYTYVFSTGAHLDSMQLKGKLIDAITGEPEEDAIVMLYKSNIDSLPLDTIPDYFTRSGADGSYLIKNIADQPYKIFALKDENANYRFDVPTEKIGFLDSLVAPFTIEPVVAPDTIVVDSLAVEPNISDTLSAKGKAGSRVIPSYDMKMFVEDDTTQFLKKAYCEYYGKLVFVYNRPVDKINVEIEGVSFKKQWNLKDFSTYRDTITVWTTDLVPDTMKLVIDAGKPERDSVEMVMKPRVDEIEVSQTSEGKGSRKKGLEKFAVTAKTDPPNGRAPKPGDALYLVWNHPIIGSDLSKVKLYEDSVRVRFEIDARDPALRKFGILFPWKKDKQYRLLVLDSAFKDIYSLWNDTLETSFKGTDKEMFGELSLNISEAPKGQLLLEVLNSANVLIESRTVSQKGVVLFSKLNPDKYNIQVVTDLNGNGKWDSGRYSEKSQPEPIKIIQQGAEVRANWNLELEWNPNTTD